MILDATDAFIEPPEPDRSEAYVPEPIIDFFETDVPAGEGAGDAPTASSSECRCCC